MIYGIHGHIHLHKIKGTYKLHWHIHYWALCQPPTGVIGLHSARYKQLHAEIAIIWAMNIIIISKVSEVQYILKTHYGCISVILFSPSLDNLISKAFSHNINWCSGKSNHIVYCFKSKAASRTPVTPVTPLCLIMHTRGMVYECVVVSFPSCLAGFWEFDSVPSLHELVIIQKTFLWLYTRQRLCTGVFLVRITHDVCINYAISMQTEGTFKSPLFLFLMSEALHIYIQCLWCPVYLWQHDENELNLRVANNLAWSPFAEHLQLPELTWLLYLRMVISKIL